VEGGKAQGKAAVLLKEVPLGKRADAWKTPLCPEGTPDEMIFKLHLFNFSRTPGTISS
jgi:hypothetical protein